MESEIISTLQQFGLFGKNIVGQSYDGASYMSGAYKGVAARIKVEYLKAIYIHCYAHRLNLALQDACSSIAEIRNALGTITSMHTFIGAFAKRQILFEEIATSENCFFTLKYLSDTRWASSHSSIL